MLTHGLITLLRNTIGRSFRRYVSQPNERKIHVQGTYRSFPKGRDE